MKNWKIFVFGFLICINTSFSKPKELDKIAAIVNHNVILESDINNVLLFKKNNIKHHILSLKEKSLLRKQVIDDLIIENIQLQLAQKVGIVLSEANLDKTITNIAMQNKISVNQLRNRLFSEGIDYNKYRSQIRKEILITTVRNHEVNSRIHIFPKEIDTLTQQILKRNMNNNQINITHILLSIPKNVSQQKIEDIKKLAIKIINKWKTGYNFKKIINMYSTNSDILNGVNIGWTKIKDIPILLEKQLKNIKKDIIIGPINSKIGLHIFKINDIYNFNKPILITEIHSRHILLKPSKNMTNNQIRNKLLKVTQDIKFRHISFSDQAKKISQDLNSSLNGGDLGWASLNTYHPVFFNILTKLKKGEISRPIFDDFGWNVIQLLDTRKVDKSKIIEKNHAYAMLLNRKFTQELQSWIKELRSKTYINIISK
ncbi:Chaperone SurA [Candidatus Ecksteinia adelgidicola]|nr:Chaperone SurA [Candidatus Ecksteinia adelgidicola]